MKEHEKTVYAEDLAVGETVMLGTRTLSQDEIIDFAREWDPQGFHVDEEVARNGAFGGIIASGLQTMGVFQRLAVDTQMGRWAVIAGRTMDDIQLTKPVRPGMELTGTQLVEAVEPRGPERALVTQVCRLLHGDEPVLSFRGTLYMRRRPTDA